MNRDFLDDVVHVFALEDKLKSMTNNLSGGQQQRVAIGHEAGNPSCHNSQPVQVK